MKSKIETSFETKERKKELGSRCFYTINFSIEDKIDIKMHHIGPMKISNAFLQC